MPTCMYQPWSSTCNFHSFLMQLNAFVSPISEQTRGCLLQNPILYCMRLQLIQGPSVCTYNLNHSFQCALYCACPGSASSSVALSVYLVLPFPMELFTFLLSLHINNLETAPYFTSFPHFGEPCKKGTFCTAKLQRILCWNCCPSSQCSLSIAQHCPMKHPKV